MKTEMTFSEMVACIEPWDQTIGCSNCNQAWWGDNATDPIENFHDDDCPLKGRRDVLEAVNRNEPEEPKR